MSDCQRNYYLFKSWISVACSRNTNGYLYENPPPGENFSDGLYSTQTNEELAKFLYECDLSDTRKEHNHQRYREKIKRKISCEKNLPFWEWVFGEKYVDGLVDDYMKRHKLMDYDEYPIWRKPVIRYVPAEKFLWDIDIAYRSRICLNDDVLLEYAKTCDILVMGTEMSNQYVITKNRNPQYDITYDGKPVRMLSQIFGGVSKAFEGQFPNYANMRFDLQPLKKTSFDSVRSKSSSVFSKHHNVSITNDVNNDGNESFEDLLYTRKFDPSLTPTNPGHSAPYQFQYKQV